MPCAAVWLWAFVGGFICLCMIPLEPSLLEEGFLLNAAQRMLAGEHLYRDIVHFTGPFPFELLSLLFRIFGEDLMVGRFALVFMQALSCAATFALARQAKAGSFAHAAAACMASAPVLLFPLFSIYFYTTILVHLSVLAAYATLRGVQSRGWAVVAGITIACAALTKQTVGLILAPALLAALAIATPPLMRRRQVLATILGGAAVTLLTLLTYGIRGDLGNLVNSLVVLPLSLGDTFNSGYMNFWPLGAFSATTGENYAFYLPQLYNVLHAFGGMPSSLMILFTQALYALPFIALGATLVRRYRNRLPAALWIYSATVLAMLVNLFPRSDWGHLGFVLPCATVQILMLAGQYKFKSQKVIAAGIIAGLGIGTVSGINAVYGLAKKNDFGPRVPLLAVSLVIKSDGLPRAIRFLREHTQRGEAIFVPRAEPLIYFATDTRNPTPFDGVIPGMREEQEGVIIPALEDVRFVVMSETDQPFFLYYSEELPAVQGYLERHYHVREEYLHGNPSWLVVYERGTDRGPTLIDLIHERSHARAWTRNEKGKMEENLEPLPKLGVVQNRRPLPFWLGHRGGGIDFEIQVPENAVFQGDIGLARVPERSGMHPQNTRLEVWVGRSGYFEHLADRAVLKDPGDGTRWVPVEVDLNAYAGQEITLRLCLASDHPLQAHQLAWWGSPRITTRRNDL